MSVRTPARRPRRSRLVATAAAVLLSTGLSAGLSTALAAPAAAAPSGSSVLQVAQRYLGVPYRLGGTTPSGLDCSGYTGLVYRQLGVQLPRTAQQQMLATRPVAARDARPGDLVFFLSGGRAYHTGIYAGGGAMYDAPKPGRTVTKRALWRAAVVFHRVG